MEFVNSIAEIVHQEVALHDGSPNKNIGDAFLLVWKLPPGFEPGLTAMVGSLTPSALIHAMNVCPHQPASDAHIEASVPPYWCHQFQE